MKDDYPDDSSLVIVNLHLAKLTNSYYSRWNVSLIYQSYDSS